MPSKTKKNITVTTQTLTPEQEAAIELQGHEEDKEDDNFFLLDHEENQEEDIKEDSSVIEQNEDNSSFISNDDELFSWLSESGDKNEAQSVFGQGDEEPTIMLDDEEEKQKEEIKKEAGHAGGFDDVPPVIIEKKEAGHAGGFDDVPPVIIEKKEDADISEFNDVEPEKDQEKENSYWDKYYDQEMKNARTDEEAMLMAAMKDFKLNTHMKEDEEEEQKEENKEVQKEEQKEDVNEDDSFVIAMDEDDDKKENKKENKEDDSFVIAMDEDEPEPVNKKEAQRKIWAATKINKNLMDAFQNIIDNKKDGKANSDLYSNIIDAYVEAMNAQTQSEFVMHMRHLSDACVNYVDNRHPISQEGKERKKIVKQLHQVVEEEIMPVINEKLDTFEVVDKDEVIGEIDKELGDDISKEDQRKIWAATKINKNLMDAFQNIIDNKKDGKGNSDLYNNIIDEYVEAMNAQTQSEFVMHMRHLSDACVKYADKRQPISKDGKERKRIVEQLHQVIEEEIMPEITKKLDTFEVVDKDEVIGEMVKNGDTPRGEKTSFKAILDEEGINTARNTKVTLTNKDKSNSNTLKK